MRANSRSRREGDGHVAREGHSGEWPRRACFVRSSTISDERVVTCITDRLSRERWRTKSQELVFPFDTD